MAREKIKTGHMHKRDYGLVVERNGTKLFFSPFDYIQGHLLLADPKKIKQRVAQHAKQQGIPARELWQAFRKGVEKKEGNTKLIEQSGRKVIYDVNRFGQFTAQVFSKSGTVPYKVMLSVQEGATPETLNLTGLYCACDDQYWNRTKGWGEKRDMETMCAHLAALDLALFYDNVSRASQKNNITGLAPKERKDIQTRQYVSTIPFTFVPQHGSNMVTDAVINYYVNGENQFTISKELLADPAAYHPALVEMITSGKAVYQPLSQREKEVIASAQNKTQFGAAKALENRIIAQLRNTGFQPDGKSLEHKDTDYEVIAKRFVQGDQVYTVVMPQEGLVYIMKKHLGAQADNPITATAQPIEKPHQQAGKLYKSIDDVTRRETVEEILVPGVNTKNLFVPQHLKQQYKQVVA